MATVRTIGYEGIALPTFLRQLVRHEVNVVIDVRATPQSRKPGFSKTKLSRSLADAGIVYRHWPELGCPRSILLRYREDGDWNAYVPAFMAHLRSVEDALAALAQEARRRRACLLCFERDAMRCHRSLIAGELARKFGFSIIHLNQTETAASPEVDI